MGVTEQETLRQTETNDQKRAWHTLPSDAVLDELSSTENGLDTSAVEEQQRRWHHRCS